MRPYAALPQVSRDPIKGQYNLPYSSLPAHHSSPGGLEADIKAYIACSYSRIANEVLLFPRIDIDLPSVELCKLGILTRLTLISTEQVLTADAWLTIERGTRIQYGQSSERQYSEQKNLVRLVRFRMAAAYNENVTTLMLCLRRKRTTPEQGQDLWTRFS